MNKKLRSTLKFVHICRDIQIDKQAGVHRDRNAPDSSTGGGVGGHKRWILRRLRKCIPILCYLYYYWYEHTSSFCADCKSYLAQWIMMVYPILKYMRETLHSTMSGVDCY